mgnify:CR=1 FL=1
MSEAATTPSARQEHFAYCLQVLGGVTAASRRLGIDERALRRFANGEREISPGLMRDTAEALRQLAAEAAAAQEQIAGMLNEA